MSKITLQQQIMLTEGRISVKKKRGSDAPLDESILASLKRLQAVYAANSSHSPEAIPEGMALVPIEPTSEMLRSVKPNFSYRFYAKGIRENVGIGVNEATDVYKAMIAATRSNPC